MERVCFSETFASTYDSTRPQNLEEQHHREMILSKTLKYEGSNTRTLIYKYTSNLSKMLEEISDFVQRSNTVNSVIWEQ
jgi:hypothetical protein